MTRHANRQSPWVPVAVTILVAMIHSLAAQTSAVSPTMDELRVPSSPAFVLLGVSPSSVERPNTPRAFALGILAATERSETSFPQDIAVEFGPYWWAAHPGLTFEEYYDPHKGVGATILQTLAVSLGTTALEDATGTEGARSALGLRFMLRQGRAAPGLAERVEALRKIQLKALDCVPDEPEEDVDQACLDKLEPGLRAAGQEVARLDKERVGLLVEFAAALAADFPDDDTRDSKVSRSGGWVTVSYHGAEELKQLTFLGVGRYIRENADLNSADRTDLGVRVIWKGDREAMPPLALSMEYVRRFVSSQDDTEKLVAVLEYVLPIENISLIASYGKTFQDDLTGKENLVSTLGLNFGFGRGPVVKAPR